MNLTLNYSILPEDFTRLEASLFYWQDYGIGIRPIKDWEYRRLNDFTHRLHILVHECLAMHLQVNTPLILPFVTDLDKWVDRPGLIWLTRQLIYCCNLELVGGFRDITGEEEQLVAILEQIHPALIGDYYFQHPGMETVDEVFFSRKKQPE